MDGPRWLSESELDAWRNFSGLLLLLPGKLDERVQPHGFTLFDYLILAALSGAPERTRRMSDLALLTQGSLSRLSHAAKRLEKRGWIMRRACADDGRVTLATMTGDGMDALVAAAPDHVLSVREYVLDRLTEEQFRQLGVISNILLEGLLDGPPPWDREGQDRARAERGET